MKSAPRSGRTQDSGPCAPASGRGGERTGRRTEGITGRAPKPGETEGRSRRAFVVPAKPANPPRGEPVEGRGAPGRQTAGGKHGGDTEPHNRVNATPADSGAGTASTADGVHHPE